MEQDEKIKNVAVETYAGDMAEVLKSDTGGLVKKIIRGEEESEMEKINFSPESRKNKIFMFTSLLLLAFALSILSFYLFRTTINTVSVEKAFVPIIFNDKSAYFEIAGLDKDEIAQTVRNEVNATKVKNGEVEGIYLTENKQVLGLRRFMALIKGNFVPGDNTLFINDNFMMGVVKAENPGFFMLLKVRSTADIFDALRVWEAAMLADLHGFLGIDVSSDTNYLFKKAFQNGVVENKNARILYKNDGEPGDEMVLEYIFADDNSVILTGSQSAAHEVMLRLAGSRK